MHTKSATPACRPVSNAVWPFASNGTTATAGRIAAGHPHAYGAVARSFAVGGRACAIGRRRLQYRALPSSPCCRRQAYLTLLEGSVGLKGCP
jgi:hypothetical protein